MNSFSPRPLLIVEDSDEDFEAIIWVLRKSSCRIPVVRCKDGQHAIDYLESLGNPMTNVPVPFPAMVLLDLNVPGVDGHAVLRHIKASTHLRPLPVVVFTTSAQTADVQSCYRLGANSYVVKPAGMVQLRELVDGLVQYWFRHVYLPQPEGSYAN